MIKILPITILAQPDREYYDESKDEFVSIKGLEKDQKLQLEHSLVSLSKWESKWHKPFIDTLTKGQLSLEETIDYIKCMTLTKNVDERVYDFISEENMKKINEYIANPMTATTISNHGPKGRNKEIMTSELIYYYMIALNIPNEFEKWHLNRLMMLIQVCSIKNEPPKKMSRRDIMSRNAALNAARRKQFNTKG